MGYDISFKDPKTKEVCKLKMMTPRGGTYCVDDNYDEAWFYVTFNYSKILFDKGMSFIKRDESPSVKFLDKKTAAECIGILSETIPKLNGQPSSDYWDPNEGNAKKALSDLLIIACNVPSNSICEVCA